MNSNDWDVRYEAATNIWSLTPNQFVVEYLGHLEPGSMIDLAGGEGRNALWFATRGWQVENSDFSGVALEKFTTRAKEEGLETACFATQVDATAPTTFALSPVDLGIIIYLQIDALGLAQAINSLCKNIKPGGTFFGVWHARENLNEGFGGPRDLDVLPTQDELRQALTNENLADFKVELKVREVSDGEITRQAIDVIAIGTKL